jgi:hypothetical protein
MGVKSTAILLVVGLAVLLIPPRASAQADDVAVVVNSGNSITNISLEELRKLFAGTKRSWTSGHPVRLITRGPGCHERLVLLKLVKMSESEYKQYWTAQVFRGDADAEPSVVPSVGMQREAIIAFSGGITLVNAPEVKPGMKVVKVDGLLPGAPGYPLH